METAKDNFEHTPLFNGSFQTLLRIDELLKHCSTYRVNDNIIGYKANLREVYKETLGFLETKERTKALKDWAKIEGYTITEQEYTILFDKELWIDLDKFDMWIRLKLHKKGVTFAKNKKAIDGMAKIMQRYKLNES